MFISLPLSLFNTSLIYSLQYKECCNTPYNNVSYNLATTSRVSKINLPTLVLLQKKLQIKHVAILHIHLCALARVNVLRIYNHNICMN